MTVNTEILEAQFTKFKEFVENKDGKLFTTFHNSSYFVDEEKYKWLIYNEARSILANKYWKNEDIGTGKILQKVNSAIQIKVSYKGQKIDNNLIDWRQKDDFNKVNSSKDLEQILFDFYKSKISDNQAFDYFNKENLSYQFIAYLFFIKSENYLPISQKKFDEIFEQIGLADFKTCGNISWDNYKQFIDIIKQVRSFLRTKDNQATLLDAHSFLWILGNQMLETEQQNSNPKENNKKNTTSIESNETPKILDEDNELTFPEGKELWRLHRSKERNRLLILKSKELHLINDSKLSCQVCGFSFFENYGELGDGYIEAHHIFPISELKEETETKTEDIALVCSNCHRMLHRRRPWINLKDLKTILL